MSCPLSLSLYALRSNATFRLFVFCVVMNMLGYISTPPPPFFFPTRLDALTNLGYFYMEGKRIPHCYKSLQESVDLQAKLGVNIDY